MQRIAILGMICLFYTFSAEAAKTSGDEAALREMGDKFVASWNQHDIKGLVAPWSEDAVLINPAGRMARGTAEITKLFTDEQTGMLKTTQTKMTFDHIRFVKADVAFADISMPITGMKTPDGKDLAEMNLHVALLATKKGKRWTWTDARPYAFMPPPTDVATNKN